MFEQSPGLSEKVMKGMVKMRIQFSVKKEEWEKLHILAKKNGYPDVPTYCKGVALKDRKYSEIWEEVKRKIEIMPSGKVFVLRDLVDNPPSNLGVKIFKHQEELKIRKIKKDFTNVNQFEKI